MTVTAPDDNRGVKPEAREPDQDPPISSGAVTGDDFI